MSTALITGSFDPVTRGHADLICRAARLFDRVEVVIFRNSQKTCCFSEEERLSFLRAVCHAAGKNVVCAADGGTVADYVKAHGITVTIKGVRNAADLAYESDMAALNRLAGGGETLFFPADPALTFCSSSAAREFLSRGLPAEALLPPAAADAILKTYEKKHRPCV